jgi:hypothetical protein
MEHARSTPYHSMTQGKIERYHRSTKNVVRLENHHTPWASERSLAGFLDHSNHRRYHEALGNVSSADTHAGRQQEKSSRREPIKRETPPRRKREGPRRAAQPQEHSENCLLRNDPNRPDCFEDLRGGEAACYQNAHTGSKRAGLVVH